MHPFLTFTTMARQHIDSYDIATIRNMSCSFFLSQLQSLHDNQGHADQLTTADDDFVNAHHSPFSTRTSPRELP